MERKGIISVGNWIVDSVKFIEVFPKKGNLTTIVRQDEGLGGCAHNVLADLAGLKSGLPLYAGGCIGNDAYGKMVMDAIHENGIDDSNMDIKNTVHCYYLMGLANLGLEKRSEADNWFKKALKADNSHQLSKIYMLYTL